MRHVISILAGRWLRSKTGKHTQVRVKEFIAYTKLTQDEANSLWGINSDIVRWIAGLDFAISEFRGSVKGGGSCNKHSRLGQYNTRKWGDKV